MKAAGATKIARYCVIFINRGAKLRKLPNIHVVDDTAIARPIKISDAIKNVGTFS
jgi:ribosome-binding factor A